MRFMSTSTVVAALVLAAAGASFSMAADPKKPAAGAYRVGYVDLALVSDEIRKTPEWQQYEKEFDETRTRLRSEIETKTQAVYLTPAERSEMQNLMGKPKPSAAEQARLKELQEKSVRLEGEFRSLSVIEKPTPEQVSRIEALAKLRQDSTTDLQNDTERAGQTLVLKQNELIDKAQDRVIKLVDGVAKTKNIDLVLDRQFVLYGGEDLTTEVVKRLK